MSNLTSIPKSRFLRKLSTKLKISYEEAWQKFKEISSKNNWTLRAIAEEFSKSPFRLHVSHEHVRFLLAHISDQEKIRLKEAQIETLKKVVLPKRIKWIDGVSNAPEIINEWLKKVPRRTRRFYYHHIRHTIENLPPQFRDFEKWKKPEEISPILHDTLDEEFGTSGMAEEDKYIQYHRRTALRSFLQFLGWSDSDLRTYMPAVPKAKPLKERVVNPDILFLYPHEFELWRDCIDEIPETETITRLHKLAYKSFIQFAFDTGTRTGDQNGTLPDGTIVGKGILGIRLQNIKWDYPAHGLARVDLYDKKDLIWHKYPSPLWYRFTKEYLEERKKVEPNFDPTFGVLYEPLKRNTISALNQETNRIAWEKYKLRKGVVDEEAIRKGEEIGCHVTPKLLRKTFATLSQLMGMDVLVACELGGWLDVTTFKRYYAVIPPALMTTWSVKYHEIQSRVPPEEINRIKEQTAKTLEINWSKFEAGFEERAKEIAGYVNPAVEESPEETEE
jgi:hypothetical protein